MLELLLSARDSSMLRACANRSASSARAPTAGGSGGDGNRLVLAQPPHFSTPITSTSTRRFFARPSSVLLSAIGLASPAPLT